MNDLKQLARQSYFNEMKIEKYRDVFLLELEKRVIVDKREEGFFCYSCNTFSKVQQMPLGMNRCIYPKDNDNEFWIVNSHYDGCRGWD